MPWAFLFANSGTWARPPIPSSLQVQITLQEPHNKGAHTFPDICAPCHFQSRKHSKTKVRKGFPEVAHLAATCAPCPPVIPLAISPSPATSTGPFFGFAPSQPPLEFRAVLRATLPRPAAGNPPKPPPAAERRIATRTALRSVAWRGLGRPLVPGRRIASAGTSGFEPACEQRTPLARHRTCSERSGTPSGVDANSR